MIFQPAIIALLLAAGLSLAMLAVASPFALQLIRHWDLGSGSERQLRLERLTYLFSMMVALVCGLQVLSTLLFVFNADKMSVMFVGAMCAVGALNANVYGFPALYAQLVAFFFAATWLAINRLDNQARDYPLTRLKYRLLLAYAPLAAAVLYLQFNYFIRLEADVITSCCGSLFSEEADTVASEVSALAPARAMSVFYAMLGGAILLAVWHWKGAGRGLWSGLAVGTASVAAFFAALAGVVAFVSLYIYEHPNHHCPFCILKPEYGYQGYLLYLPLFAAAAAGLAAGVLSLFGGRPNLATLAPQASARLAGIAAAGFALFVLGASVMVLRSNLILIE
ncbi:hypothetical protein [Thauera sp.]|uniref:hypothetical protein n=1 Tax=Thauera sp. TaxID=1905334 RepID=UPI002627C84C|nr:hypothetical protein [Thauera sp.]MCK6409259.1 hypothetical protein [Thauera sp.]